MNQEQIDHIHTLEGKNLFDVMRNAYKKNDNETIKVCYQRSKELNNTTMSTWAEAKANFNSMPFPTWKNENKEQFIKIGGYVCVISQSVSGTMELKSRTMTLCNHKTNQAIVRQIMQNGQTMFN